MEIVTHESSYEDAVSSMSTEEKKILLDDTDDDVNPVRKVAKKFKIHPSILGIEKPVFFSTGKSPFGKGPCNPCLNWSYFSLSYEKLAQFSFRK